jgi:Tripartite tricarboxylate transporter TctB family
MSAGERAVTIGIVLAVAALLVDAVWIEQYRWVLLRFPLFIGVAAIVFALAHLARGARSNGAPMEPAPQAAAAPARPNAARIWIGIGWMAAVLPAILILGYPIGLTLYVGAYLATHGAGWRLAVASAAGTLVVTYYVFGVLLAVPLPLLPLGFE